MTSTSTHAQLCHLLYVSVMRGDDFTSLGRQIVQKAVLKNALIGITGFIAFNGPNVAQLLEGPENQVERLFSVIREDPRHVGVTVILFEAIAERSFPSWSMQQCKVSDAVYLALREGHVSGMLG